MDADVTWRGARNLVLVRDDNQRHAAGLLNASEDLHNSGGVRAVEIPSGLICQQDRRVIGQRPSNRYALPFSRREFIGMLAHSVLQPHFTQQCLGTFLAIAGAISRREHGGPHVFDSAQGGQSVESLEDESNMMAAIRVEANRRAQRRTAEQDIAAGGGIEPAEQVEQGRFTTTAVSANGNEFASVDGEIDTAESLDASFVVVLAQ